MTKLCLYIPLCFYYIAVAAQKDYAASLPLHSTMLLLYRIISNEIITAKRLYIPLCFYYIEKIFGKRYIDFELYIPLCFYYIHTIPGLAFPGLLALHSTMLLLYQTVLIDTVKYHNPLHSTMLLLYLTRLY